MSAHDRQATLEAALARRLYGATHVEPERLRHGDLDALQAEVLRRLRQRRDRGAGTLEERFAPVFAAWAPRPHAELIAAIARHPALARWTPSLPGGAPLEHAFCQAVASLDLLPAPALERLRLSSLARALAVDPDPRFAVPAPFRGQPGRWVAVSEHEPWMAAAVDGRVMQGALTPLLADLLRGVPPCSVAQEHGLGEATVGSAVQALRQRGLWVASPGD